MKVLVAGGRGQLGRSLVRRAGRNQVVALGIDALDVTAPATIDQALRAHAPDVVIDAAAFTGVDRAETERDRAFAINAGGAANLARACAEHGVAMVYVSTDYVFDGSARRPYREHDAPAPVNAYGASKLAGERATLDAGGVVVRTSWLFGDGGPSFVHTMLELARDRGVLRVVDDQHGCPTCSDDLATALLALCGRDERAGIYHACGAEPTTWHAFAAAIVDEARRHAAIACERVEPIATADYPTPARRPAYSVLDTGRLASLAIELPSFRGGLAAVVAAELGAR